MKAIMHFNKIEEWVAWIFGITGGCIAYANMPILLHLDWSFLLTSIFKLLWTGFVALFSGAMGVVGKRLVEHSKWFKNIFK